MRAKLSYANVMATVACFIALGGGAYAAATIDSGDIAKNAVLSKHIKNNKVTGKDVKESSLKGVNPLAYAHVVDGAVVPGESLGVTVDDSENSSGAYCFRVTGQPENVQVTIERESLDNSVVASLDPPSLAGNPCSGSAEVLVYTGNQSSFLDRDFYIVFH